MTSLCCSMQSNDLPGFMSYSQTPREVWVVVSLSHRGRCQRSGAVLAAGGVCVCLQPLGPLLYLLGVLVLAWSHVQFVHPKCPRGCMAPPRTSVSQLALGPRRSASLHPALEGSCAEGQWLLGVTGFSGSSVKACLSWFRAWRPLLLHFSVSCAASCLPSLVLQGSGCTPSFFSV